MNNDNEVQSTSKLSVEKVKVEKFFKDFKEGRFGEQRLGQAFSNEFNLQRLSNQAQLMNLYARDGDHAKRLIFELFDMT